jgi:hypothetical protein
MASTISTGESFLFRTRMASWAAVIRQISEFDAIGELSSA